MVNGCPTTEKCFDSGEMLDCANDRPYPKRILRVLQSGYDFFPRRARFWVRSRRFDAPSQILFMCGRQADRIGGIFEAVPNRFDEPQAVFDGPGVDFGEDDAQVHGMTREYLTERGFGHGFDNLTFA